jgi:hypothetical protein
MLCSKTGMMKGTIQLAPVKSGTLASILAGGHVLISRRTDPVSGKPDCNAEVCIERF